MQDEIKHLKLSIKILMEQNIMLNEKVEKLGEELSTLETGLNSELKRIRTFAKIPHQYEGNFEWLGTFGE